MIKYLIAFALAAVVAFAADTPPARKRVIGMSQCNLGEPWRVQMNADIKAVAATHPEIEVVFKDAQNDALKQRAQIEEFINSGVDLLQRASLTLCHFIVQQNRSDRIHIDAPVTFYSVG